MKPQTRVFLRKLAAPMAVLAVVLLGTFLFRGRLSAWISLCAAILSVVPFFFAYERKKLSVGRLLILTVLVALSVFGRYAFAFVPHFKPVTAVVVIAGLYLGAESGFLCGAMSALLSNFLFGQGPWTPFQMFAWGMIGLLAGLLARPMRRSLPLLLLFGALSGVFYSALLDVWSTLWMDGAFVLSRYAFFFASSLPVMGIYAASNVAFLLLLAKPIGSKLERILFKYGI